MKQSYLLQTPAKYREAGEPKPKSFIKRHLFLVAVAIGAIVALSTQCHGQTTTLYGVSDDAELTFTYSNSYEGVLTATNKTVSATLYFETTVNLPDYQQGVTLAFPLTLQPGATESRQSYYYGQASNLVFVYNGKRVPLSPVPEPSVALLSLGALVMFRRRRISIIKPPCSPA